MPEIKRQTSSQYAALVRLFSATIINQFTKSGRSPLFSRLALESKIANSIGQDKPIRDLFDAAFAELGKKQFRHEYVYKSALTQKILLGKHSLNSASMLSEFRVGKSKADVVILNGTSTVYEIKSERDNLDRLDSQINSYLKVFANVNVITGEHHVDEILVKTPKSVGVLILTDRFQISTIRESINDPGRVKPDVIFDSVRLDEAKKILELFDVQLPAVPNTILYETLKSLFLRLDPTQAHQGMVQILRTTRSLKSLEEYLFKTPKSLRAAVVSSNTNKKSQINLLGAVNTSVKNALAWA